MENPKKYLESNINGFLSILEFCKLYKIKHLVYASSSSVYGLNESLPFSTKNSVGHPASIYAATKRTNELMAHTYSHLYKLPTTGLRFFTVYGPWDRPDMALQNFTKSILSGKDIKLYNNGNHGRDFTYIDDIVEGIYKVIITPPMKDSSWSGINPRQDRSSAPWRIYNIGNNNIIKLKYFIETLENVIGKKINKIFLPLQPGDVVNTHADIDDFVKDFNYKPKINIEEGLQNFISWYNLYYKK